jgi:hypothetical protein
MAEIAVCFFGVELVDFGLLIQVLNVCGYNI